MRKREADVEKVAWATYAVTVRPVDDQRRTDWTGAYIQFFFTRRGAERFAARFG